MLFAVSSCVSAQLSELNKSLQAYPIVYQQGRGWNAGVGGLPFLSIAVGMLIGCAYVRYLSRKLSIKLRTCPDHLL